jgi:assimilatory nitrate reductase catalytic subunit
MPAQAFVAMHWSSEWLGGANAPGVNTLLGTAACPQSRQPELKHATVRVERAELPWALQAAVWWPADDALALRERLDGLLHAQGWAYASVLPFGRDEGVQLGLQLRVAAAEAPTADTVAALAALLGLHGEAAAGCLEYADARGGRQHQLRRVRLRADGALAAVLLAGDTTSFPWLLGWLQGGADARAFGPALLRPGAQPPPAAGPGRGAVLCSCNDVAEADIARALQGCAQADPATQRAAVQRATRCGTTCGSCLPALQRRLRAVDAVHTSALKEPA